MEKCAERAVFEYGEFDLKRIQGNQSGIDGRNSGSGDEHGMVGVVVIKGEGDFATEHELKASDAKWRCRIAMG